MPNKLKSLLFFSIFLLIAGLSIGFLVFDLKQAEKEFLRISFASISTLPERKSATLMFVGDIMLSRGVEYAIEKQGNGDFKFPFLKIADFLKKANILFGNLEGPISDKGKRVGSIYSFRDDPKAIEGLTFSGFNILSIANNHIFDYGRSAMEDTFSRLKDGGIDYVGGGFSEAEAHAPVIKEIKGAKIAFLAYTNLGSEYWSAKGENSGINWLDGKNLKEDIALAKKDADLVIVSMHFGDEYQDSPNSEQKLISHSAIDFGADLVIGHHPHVIQPIEEYKGKYIAYSLGNFVFDQGFSEKTMKGLLLKVLVENKKIKKIIPVEIKINQFFQPEIVNE